MVGYYLYQFFCSNFSSYSLRCLQVIVLSTTWNYLATRPCYYS